MQRPKSVLVLGALLALSAAQAMATGFGRMNNATTLGQQLDFTVPLRLDAGESVSADCVTAEVLSGEFRVPPSQVRVALDPGSDANERLIRVATRATIDEPVVTVTLQLGCTNALTRKFVAFVDPPVIQLASAAPARPAATVQAAPSVGPRQQVAIATPPTPTAAAAQPAETAAPPAKKTRRPTASTRSSTLAVAASRSAKARTASRSTRKTSTSQVAAAAPVAKGSRLKLDAPEVMLAQAPLRLSDALPDVLPPAAPQDAASAPVDANAESAAQREKLAALEASFARLQTDAQATQASLLLLQAQLRESQTARYSNPLVYALIALVVLLGAAVVFLLRQQASARRAAPQWWAPPTGTDVAAMAVDASAAQAQPAPGPVAVRPELWDAPEHDVGETTASPRLLAPGDAPASAAAPLEVQREMSVEELIDLEQQAEFFVVLGQDEAAIDLLMSHLRSSGGTSPLPYLKLLEIYRRRDDHEAYERTREKFNRRFNAYAPDWDTDLQKGRALEDYPHVVTKLQSLWTSPAQTMQTLEASLFRRDPGVSNFDLPAYRELLFLYSVARDLSEHAAEHGVAPAAPTKVDLLLPIDAETSATGTLTRLHPTRPMPLAPDAYTTQVDVDITTLDAGPSALARPEDRPSRFMAEFNTTPGYIGLAGEKAAGSG
ncbi:MAG: hypothetical protein M9915_10390 [Rhizobacter sp.]|nr:hypothetical protein [Rhizobacter sp.]